MRYPLRDRVVSGVIVGNVLAAIVLVVHVLEESIGTGEVLAEVGIGFGGAVAVTVLIGNVGGALFGVMQPLASRPAGKLVVGAAIGATVLLAVGFLIGVREWLELLFFAVGGALGGGLPPFLHALAAR